MKVAIYASQPAAGQLTARQAKKTAHAAGLTDLTLNRYGCWVAYNEQLDLVRVDFALAAKHNVV